MSEWIQTSIESLLESSFAGDWGAEPRGNGKDAIVFRGADFNPTGRLSSTAGVPRNVSVIKLKKVALKLGDILLEKSGGSPDQPVGRVSLFQGATGVATASNFLQTLRPRNGIDSEFLFYLLQYEYRTGRVLPFQQQTTGLINFRLKDYLKEVVALPSAQTEQRGIAEVLSALDEQIEQTEALTAKEALVRNAILNRLVMESNAPYVPIDTLATKVGSGVTPTGGSEVYKSSGVTFVRSQNVLNEQLDLADVAFVTQKIHAGMGGSQLEDHDVLLNITGASIGRCCSVPTGFGEANVNQHVCIIRLHGQRKTDALLMAALICSDFGQRELNKQISGGNREGLNYPQVRAMCVPWPQSGETRVEMALVLESARLAAQALTLEAAKLRLQKQGLMRDLLTGKTRVQ